METNLLKNIKEKYPEFLTSQHLVEIGLAETQTAIYLARSRGCCPPYIKMGRKVLYPKIGVIEFLKKNLVASSIPKNDGDKMC